MFTGIVQELGRVAAHAKGRLRVEARLGRLPRGASVSVNGVCLTVVRQTASTVEFELSPETLRRTNLGRLKPRDGVNLEPALKASDPLGGHWVSGHVDAPARILELEAQPGGFARLRVELPPALSRLVAEKGSIAVDGTSLTVTAVGPRRNSAAAREQGIVSRRPRRNSAAARGQGRVSRRRGWFETVLVPHTLEHTTLGERRAGDRVNLEADMLARYLDRLLEARR